MTNNKLCFVISPIGEEGSAVRAHADDVFRFIVEPAMRELEIEPVRADHRHKPGPITEQMFRDIMQADVCLALLTGHNPNVFYELAVAQAAARPVILLIEKGQALPFDIKDLRTVIYELQPIIRLVDGEYADRVKEQLYSLQQQNWLVPGLMEQHNFAPPLSTEKQLRNLIKRAHPLPLPEGEDMVFALRSDPERRLVIRTGDIGKTLEQQEVHVIVSLEDTYLQLARYYDASISGILRFHDAEKSPGGRIIRDCLFESLHKQVSDLKIHLPLTAGNVLATRTKQLAKYGVKYIFHLAALQGQVGDGYHMMDNAVDDCAINVMDKFASLASRNKLQSILFPMLGAGTTRLEPVEVARRLLEPIVQKMKIIPHCRTIYLLTWLESHRHAVHQVAAEMKEDLEESKAQ